MRIFAPRALYTPFALSVPYYPNSTPRWGRDRWCDPAYDRGQDTADCKPAYRARFPSCRPESHTSDSHTCLSQRSVPISWRISDAFRIPLRITLVGALSNFPSSWRASAQPSTWSPHVHECFLPFFPILSFLQKTVFSSLRGRSGDTGCTWWQFRVFRPAAVCAGSEAEVSLPLSSGHGEADFIATHIVEKPSSAAGHDGQPLSHAPLVFKKEFKREGAQGFLSNATLKFGGGALWGERTSTVLDGSEILASMVPLGISSLFVPSRWHVRDKISSAATAPVVMRPEVDIDESTDDLALVESWKVNVLVVGKLLQLCVLSFPAIIIGSCWAALRGLSHTVDTIRGSSVKDVDNGIPFFRLRALLGICEKKLLELLWEAIYWAAQTAGPTYVKLVQWMGTRADLFPKSVCFRCARFHCAVPPHPYPYTALALKRAFQEKPNLAEVDLTLDPVAVGAGAIGQVYRGQVVWGPEKENRQVAVKVLHPGIASSMRIDLALLKRLGTLVELFPSARWLAISESMMQFQKLMVPQLDLLQEARHLRQFYKNFSTPQSRERLARLRARVRIPTVYEDLSTSEVLVQSFENGMILGKWMRSTSSSVGAGMAVPAPAALPKEESEQQWTSKGYFLRYLEEAVGSSEESGDGPLASTVSSSIGLWGDTRTFLRVSWNYASNMLRGLQADVAARLRRRVRKTGARICSLLHFDSWAHRLSEEPLFFTFDDYHRGDTNGLWTTLQRRVGDAGLAFFLQMVFVDNYVHADLHPGNMLIRLRKPLDWQKPPPTRSNEAAMSSYSEMELPEERALFSKEDDPEDSLIDCEIILLDCGLVTFLSGKEFVNLTDLFLCLCRGNGRLAGNLIIDRARKHQCTNREAFCTEVDRLLQMYYAGSEGSMELSRIRIGEYLARMLTLACSYRVEIDPRFVSVSPSYPDVLVCAIKLWNNKSAHPVADFHCCYRLTIHLYLQRCDVQLILAVIILEGVGRQLNPSLDLFTAGLPYLRYAVARLQ